MLFCHPSMASSHLMFSCFVCWTPTPPQLLPPPPSMKDKRASESASGAIFARPRVAASGPSLRGDQEGGRGHEGGAAGEEETSKLGLTDGFRLVSSLFSDGRTQAPSMCKFDCRPHAQLSLCLAPTPSPSLRPLSRMAVGCDQRRQITLRVNEANHPWAPSRVTARSSVRFVKRHQVVRIGMCQSQARQGKIPK